MKVAECVRGIQAGQRHVNRTVLGCPFTIGKYRGKDIWAVVVQCDCGAVGVVRLGNLKHGAAERCRACHNKRFNTVHGGAPATGERERLHNIWCSMRQRCNDTNHKRYHQYGGRGIKVCQEWDSYDAFREWAWSSGYESDLSIDRINNDRGYEPGNCQWITKSENSKKQHTDKKARKTIFSGTKPI